MIKFEVEIGKEGEERSFYREMKGVRLFKGRKSNSGE